MLNLLERIAQARTDEMMERPPRELLKLREPRRANGRGKEKKDVGIHLTPGSGRAKFGARCWRKDDGEKCRERCVPGHRLCHAHLDVFLKRGA